MSPQGTTPLPPSHKENTFSQDSNLSLKFLLSKKNNLIDELANVRNTSSLSLKHRPVACWWRGTAAKTSQTWPRWPGWASRCAPSCGTWSASDGAGSARSWQWWLRTAGWTLKPSQMHTGTSPVPGGNGEKQTCWLSWLLVGHDGKSSKMALALWSGLDSTSVVCNTYISTSRMFRLRIHCTVLSVVEYMSFVRIQH